MQRGHSPVQLSCKMEQRVSDSEVLSKRHFLLPEPPRAAFQCPAAATAVTRALFRALGIGAGAAALCLAWPWSPARAAPTEPQPSTEGTGATGGFSELPGPAAAPTTPAVANSGKPLAPISIRPQSSRKSSTPSVLRRIHISSVSKIYVLWFSLTNFFFF